MHNVKGTWVQVSSLRISMYLLLYTKYFTHNTWSLQI